MNNKPSIVWFRNDLRVDDQPALNAAIEKGGGIIPLFVWDPEKEGEWGLGGASRWWLHFSLLSLKEELSKIGLKLIIRENSTLKAIQEVINESGADAIYWNRRYEPISIASDTAIKSELQKQGIKAQSFNGSLLFEPWEIANKQNKPFQVFTPFWKHCLAQNKSFIPLKKITQVNAHNTNMHSSTVEDLRLLPRIHWDEGLKQTWRPGCSSVHQVLKDDIEHVIPFYLDQRDFPAIKGTSRLSPYLHFGEISPRMIWHTVKERFGSDSISANGYLRQIIWREFAHHLLYYFPYTTTQPLKDPYRAFPWVSDSKGLKAWQKGQTGYPIVDAGMRELWHTGWMHNRVRLIVGSFLVKDLLIQWQEGAKWFWDTLVDANLANNTMGWQWIAGCGADAAPYFRIFNPITQGEKFDDRGEYVRKWVPELKKVPDKWLQKPWEAPVEVLASADVTLGLTYPKPIIDHSKARDRALEAFAKVKAND